MFPGDLTDMVPMMLLALAVGCGAPALIYLAFKGKLRESKESKSEQADRENVEKPPSPHLGGRKDFLPLPALVEGYVYISKDVLEMLIEEVSAKQAKPTEKQVKSSGEEKPPLVRRIGA